MPDLVLEPQSAFADIEPVNATAGKPGLLVTDRDGLRCVLVAARAGRGAVLRERMQAAFGIALPAGPRRVQAGDVATIGIGPGAWLVMSEDTGLDVADRLAGTLGDTAAVTDQSDGYAVLRLDGPAVGQVLAKGIALDLHPTVFGADANAVTLVGHIGVLLWRVEPREAGHPLAIEMAAPRSSFGSFWSWLAGSSTSVGIALLP